MLVRGGGRSHILKLLNVATVNKMKVQKFPEIVRISTIARRISMKTCCWRCVVRRISGCKTHLNT